MAHFTCLLWTYLFVWSSLAAPEPKIQHINATVDYVIVGGGPAGLVLAEKLSRDPETTVILLEAGPNGDNDPLIYSKLLTS